MAKLQENEGEDLRHSVAIDGLAKSQGGRLDEIRTLYESILADLKQNAVITDFLPIFAARKVKDILRMRDEGGPGGLSLK